MNILSWFKKKPSKAPKNYELDKALIHADKALTEAQKAHEEAVHLTGRLFAMRQENHYAQKIKAAYEMDTR
jgi:hypothetical protein